MSETDDKSVSDNPEQTAELVGPKASRWLWQPWYAQLWWTTATIFWSAAFFAPNPSLNAYQVALLLLFFHPFLVVPVLGFGFIRAWVCHHFTVTGGQGADPDTRLRNTDLRMDPTDPTDSSYYGHPGNPLSEAWRNEHVRGIH
jgi:hypothetical protein